jgi:divalent metal cation (Fe/Co/Zn/Cd) transporter
VVGCCGSELPARANTEPEKLRRWAWWLTVATIAWNFVEGLVAVGSGFLARSIALVGFGLDSFVEAFSALVIAWRLWRQGPDDEANERAERRAVRLIALSFFGIAAYVTADAVAKIMGADERPETSGIGLALVVLSLVVMPVLAWAKRRVASALNSPALQADAAETRLCAYLSGVVLIGLAANALAGWWWMDPVAGLVVAGLAINEGRGAWVSGDLCGCGEGALALTEAVRCPAVCCPTCPLVLA